VRHGREKRRRRPDRDGNGHGLKSDSGDCRDRQSDRADEQCAHLAADHLRGRRADQEHGRDHEHRALCRRQPAEQLADAVGKAGVRHREPER
jgi:hypothetical protein